MAPVAEEASGPYTASREAEWLGLGVTSATAAFAGICCDMKKAATTVASVGAAAIGAPRGIRIRDGLLWRPNGILSERGALTGEAARGVTALRSAWHWGA